MVPGFELTKQEFDITKLLHAAAYSLAKRAQTMLRHTASPSEKELDRTKARGS